MRYSRVYLIILDGLGVGGAPDAAAYGDEGSDTLRHVLELAPTNLPALRKMGLGNLYTNAVPGIKPTATPLAHHARLTEVSAGKDTTTGHWELTGVVREVPAPTFPQGFPPAMLTEFSNRVGRGLLGNRPASGTEIIQELGSKHLASGDVIIYTSADSVFQIAAHTDVVPVPVLYSYCEIARGMLTGSLAVDRVIARPFTGSQGSGFVRTSARRDFALPPPEPTILDELARDGWEVIGIGKIHDIFAGRGLTDSIPEHGNREMMQQVSRLAGRDETAGTSSAPGWRGLLFCNLVDFDMLYGHRNNPQGFSAALAEFDEWLGRFVSGLANDELLIITADHGNDPTTPSTDHSREQVPVLITDTKILRDGGRMLTPPAGLFHVGRTIVEALGTNSNCPGQSLLVNQKEEP